MENLSTNILIVDDIPENLQILDKILKTEGYKVRKAISGEAALRACQSSLPDLILLDIRMPEMDGYQVCTNLKKDPKTQEIPVIFISALDEIFNKVKAFEIGGIDYITKPFQEEEVMVRIKSQLTIQSQKKLLQQEIQHRREMESVLYESRSLISSVLNTSPDGIAVMEAVRSHRTGKIVDFRCLVVNPVIAKKFGQNPNYLVGKLIVKYFTNKIHPSLFDELVTLVEGGKHWEKDLSYPHQNREFWYHCIAVKLGDGFAINIRDITDRKHMELTLEQTNQELESFNYTVAHDLRNPLGCIISANDFLISQYREQLDERGQHFLEIINKSTQRMTQIIDDLLILSQFKVSQMTITCVDLSNIVNEIVTKLKFREPQRKVILTINQNLKTEGDSKFLKIALENLIENAWKYTSKQEISQIEFGVLLMNNQEHREQLSKNCQSYFHSEIKTLLKQPSQLVYFIKDNGDGFDMSQAEEIFTPFKRLHSDTQFPGTGIGLSIVERVILRHHGTILFHSQPHQGTTFYFTVSHWQN